jgi:DNA-binding SARP family transcriptional activator
MQLRLLGPMAVIGDGGPLKLPASRKTRALLAYLAAEGRPVRRERLCHLFWEVPDDPKGALRWSLSKLRGLLGDAIVADRETAALDLAGLSIDFIELKTAAANLAATPSEQLQQIAPPPPACSCATSTCPIATTSTPGGSPPARIAAPG